MKHIMMIIMALSLLLVACDSETTGTRVDIPSISSPTGSASVETTAEAEQTAAEALEELKAMEGAAPAQGQTSATSGTFYPPVITDAQGKDALAAKTDALMRTGTPAPETGDKTTGPKYHGSSGATNLPEGYSDNEGD